MIPVSRLRNAAERWVGTGASIRIRTVVSFFAVFMPVLVFMLLAGRIVYTLQYRAEENLTEKNESLLIDFQATLISNQLNSAIEDIQELSENIARDLDGLTYRNGMTPELITRDSATPGVDDSTENATQPPTLANRISSFLKRKTSYSGCMIFRETGERVMEINFEDGVATIIPLPAEADTRETPHILQNALALDESTIFVSRMELAGTSRPVVRFVMSISTIDKARLFLELEYDGRRLIDMIRNASSMATGEVMLLNAIGYWLLSPRAEDEWGFLDPGKLGRTFPAAFPEVWESMILTESDLYRVENGLFVFRAVYPIMDPQTALPAANRRIEYDLGLYGGFPRNGEYRDRLHWYLVSFVPDSHIRTKIEPFRNRLLLLSGIVILVLAAVSLLLAFTRKRRLLAEVKVEEEATIFTNNPAPVLRIDSNGGIVKLNPAAARIIDYSARRAHTSDFFTNFDFRLMQRLSENTQFQFEQQIGNRHFLFSVKKHPGEDTCLLYGSDITGLKEIEREIRKLSAAVEQSATAILITDISGTITFANEACARSSGYAIDELIGENTRIFRSGHQADDVYRELWETISSGNAWHGSLRNRKKSGEYYWEDVSITPVRTDDGEMNGYLAVKEDITHRMAFETQLRTAKDEAEAANRLKSEFLANMSHEIRTPLNAVIGFTDVLLESEAISERRRNLEIIKRSGTHLLTLIQDILDFSKIEADKVRIVPTAFAIRGVIDHLTSLLDESVREKGLVFEAVVEESVPPVFSGDEHRITQILINVLSNAIKFTEHGSVRFACEYINKELVLKVSDTGIGIEKEKIETIFSAFEQASSSTERMYGGTGLGLAISKRLTELMAGSIVAESAIGVGSTFTIRLPLPTASIDLVELVEEVPENTPEIGLVERWFASMGKDPLLHGVLRKGIRDLPVKLQKLETALEIPDLEQMLLVAHDLKGYTGNLGMREIYEIARSLHDGLRQERLTVDDCRTHVERLRSILRSIPDQYFESEDSEISPATILENGERRRLRVLSAEDNEANRELYRVLLDELDVVSSFAVNGREVIDALNVESFDVLLLDMWMPVMDGFETLQAIRVNPAWDKLHIIAITAHAMEGDADKYLSQGCNDYLSKPIDRLLFREKLKALQARMPVEK